MDNFLNTYTDPIINKNFKIAVGLKEFEGNRVNSLIKSQSFAEITIVTDKNSHFARNIPLKVFKDHNPEQKLISLLKTKQVEGILRGSLDAVKLHNEYYNIFHEQSITVPALLNKDKTCFFLTLLSGFHGWNKNEKFKETEAVSKFLIQSGIEPKIAIFTAVRKKSLVHMKSNISNDIYSKLKETITDTEILVAKLNKHGYNATNWEIELQQAIKENYNILVPINGIVGNQIFRVFIVCGYQNIFSPRLGVSQYYADNDRNQGNLYHHIKNLSICIQNEISFK